MQITSPWREITAPGDVARFCEIMRLMDDRYAALDPPAIEAWRQRKARRLRIGKIFSYDDSADEAPLRQMIALSFKARDADATDAAAENLSIEMAGVAIDALGDDQLTETAAILWFQRFVELLVALTGLENPLVAMRPKTMTFPLMQRVHDYVAEGKPVPHPQHGNIGFIVDHEQDRGDALFWHLRIVKK